MDTPRNITADTPLKLVSGGEDHPLLPHLCAAIHQAQYIDMAVAFIKVSGLRLLLPDLLEALQRRGTQLPPAQLRILTSDYLEVTDPQALRLLMLLAEQGAEVRIYESQGSSFHLKAYLFAGADWGRAFIGSSNISRQALRHGLEWNYRIDYPGDDGYLEARRRFEALFHHPRSTLLSDAWIADYQQRRAQTAYRPTPDHHDNDLPPTPNPLQCEALEALRATRAEGYQRGLVVLATGLGKTWLAAFDVQQMGAQRVLFVAHREEILNQAAATFARIQPRARIGFYRGQQRDTQVDWLCASVQTLGRAEHLERFAPQHFDYVVVDEFHHASAPTYRRLLQHFTPGFLLGLTATPDRTDNADILALCDDNLVYQRNLFCGVQAQLLVPFHYYGILDSEVDYQAIPWRNGRFDPELLASKLATLSRARHALQHWQQHAQQRTLAFCVSTRHADYMARYFSEQGIRAAAVYADSVLSRGEALERLENGTLQVLFCVDLFNEGVDLPGIDTVMLLRPTESKILFLQQLGRGLRRAEGKERLVVLDFVANHRSFLHKPMALMNHSMNHRQLADFARQAEQGQLALPKGCFINYDLAFLDFLKSLDSDSVLKEYRSLCETLGRRPSLSEFYRAGASLQEMRRLFGHWFALVAHEDEAGTEAALSPIERQLIDVHGAFLQTLETSALHQGHTLVTLEAFQQLDGWRNAVSLSALAEQAWQILQRRRALLRALPESYRHAHERPADWPAYWQRSAIAPWCRLRYFSLEDEQLIANLMVEDAALEPLSALVQELIDYRLSRASADAEHEPASVVTLPQRPQAVELAYFPSLQIACGHFRSSRADHAERRTLARHHGALDPSRHCLARAVGHSMNGGKQPIRDGDYLLLEVLSGERGGSITGSVLAIERQDEAGDNQYLLRQVLKEPSGQYRLRAYNPDYADILVSPELQQQFRTFARLKAVIDPLEMQIGQRFMREDIPALFGVAFNPGSWNSGHVVIAEHRAHVLLVTLNKQGKAMDLRYHDHWIDAQHFHWQTQNQTSPDSKRGREIIQHAALGIAIHLFVREHKLENGKAAPFCYHGTLSYQSHSGSQPMSVRFALNAG